MKGFDCRDESLWIPKYNFISGYKERSIHLRWLEFSGEGAIGGWKHTAAACMLAISRVQLSRHVRTFKDPFFLRKPWEESSKTCHQKLDHPWKVWKVWHIPLQRAVAEACLGFFIVSYHLKCDLPHLGLSTAAKFLATVTQGIVLFHGSATSTLLWLSTHKSVKIEISGLRLSELGAIFSSLRETALSSAAQPSSRRKMH